MCFTRKDALNRHKKTHGSKLKFRCSKCYRKFEQASNKIKHERQCEQQPFECDICRYQTIYKSALTNHMRTHTGEKPFECPICFKSFTSNAHLQDHLKTRKNELPNACSKCGYRFATPEKRQKHEVRCQRKMHACNQCGYKTIHKANLKRHMQWKHGADRLIECEVCQKQFVEQIRLNQHLSTAHNDEFPFQCSKCYGGYTTEDERNDHEQICRHRRYQCHLCKKYCRYKQQLNIHMRKVHTGERIRCKVCAASFISEGYVKQHMKTAHF